MYTSIPTIILTSVETPLELVMLSINLYVEIMHKTMIIVENIGFKNVFFILIGVFNDLYSTNIEIVQAINW